jgi:hypothetical protein
MEEEIKKLYLEIEEKIVKYNKLISYSDKYPNYPSLLFITDREYNQAIDDARTESNGEGWRSSMGYTC